jgi:hypothetical protein
MSGFTRMSAVTEQARAGVNAYADITAADRWFAARQISAWAQAQPASRQAVLIRAADWLDTQFRFRGERVRAGQLRVWPRSGIAADISPGGLPLPVQTAYFELALALLDGDEAAERLLGLRGAVRSERVGSLAIEYAVPNRNAGRDGGRDGGRIRAMLAPYLRTGLATKVTRT